MAVIDDLRRSMQKLKGSAVVLSVNAEVDPVTGEAVPVPVGTLAAGGGGGGTVSLTKPTNTYPAEVLTADGTEKSLTPPSGATHALITVTSGAVRIGYGTASTATSYAKGAAIEVSYAQIPAIRFTQDGAGTLRVEYWREA